MKSVEKLRSGLINRILSIENKEFLKVLDSLIASNKFDSETLELSKEQLEMLEMSEKDISNGELISQDAMDKRNLEWLSGL